MGSDSETEKSSHKEKKKVLGLAPIAKPLAGKKLCKRTFKLVRRGLFLDCYLVLCVYFLSRQSFLQNFNACYLFFDRDQLLSTSA